MLNMMAVLCGREGCKKSCCEVKRESCDRAGRDVVVVMLSWDWLMISSLADARWAAQRDSFLFDVHEKTQELGLGLADLLSPRARGCPWWWPLENIGASSRALLVPLEFASRRCSPSPAGISLL